MGKPIVVIGGGLGGLSAAIHLASRGRRVKLLEQNAQLGGKCNHREWEGFHFDTGPSLLTMPFVVDDLFAAAGRKREDYLEFIRVTPACRYFFPDGSIFDAPGTLDGFRDAVARDYPGDLAGFDQFIDYAQKLWEVSGPLFLFNRMDASLVRRIRPRHAVAGLAAMRPWTMRQSIEHYFSSPNLRQLFSRYATYNGSDPWRAPATFNVISYVEMAFGSWHIKGGIYALVRALAKLAEELGVEAATGERVARILFSDDGRKVAGVEMGGGQLIETGEVVVNADAIGFLTGEVCSNHPDSGRWRGKWAKREASSSGTVQLMAVTGDYHSLACHNIFFNANYRDEFQDLFDAPQPLRDPTIYLAAPCKIDPSQSPCGAEAWFVLVNAPAIDERAEWPADYDAKVVRRLEAGIPGFDASRIRWSESLPPSFLRDAYGAWRGSIYGPSSNDRRSAFFRVPPRAPVKGMYFAGGSAHPGGGIPLVLTSGRLAAELL